MFFSKTIKTVFLCALLFSTHYIKAQGIRGFYGYTKGQASVTGGGSASYTINLLIPPGTNGVQPSLSLNYNSHTSNGIFGIGFNLGGISVISVANPNILTDDYYNNTALNRLTLDGQKLVLAPESIDTTLWFNHNYGKTNTIYHTENQSFVKIAAFEKTSNDKIKYFRAYTKSGEIIEYGNTEDSRIYLPGTTTPIHWLVNKIEDRNGNFIVFKYLKNINTGEFLPDKISYTGNSVKGLAPYNSIQFSYESRKDSSTYYLLNTKLTNNTKRVSKITCFAGDTPVRNYKFTYLSSDLLKYKHPYSLIREIHEYSGDENSSSSSSSLFKTTYHWQQPSFPSSKTHSTYSIFNEKLKKSNSAQQFFLDFNSDGITDFLYFNILTGENILYQNFTARYPTEIVNPISPALLKDGYLHVLDLNLDGTNDIVWYNPFTSARKFFFSENVTSNTSFKESLSITLPSTGKTPFEKNQDITLKDFDGDGRTDFIFYSRNDNGQMTQVIPDIWLNKSTTIINPNFGKEYKVIFEKYVDEIEFPRGEDRPAKKLLFEDIDNNGKLDITILTDWGPSSFMRHEHYGDFETLSEENARKRVLKMKNIHRGYHRGYFTSNIHSVSDLNGDNFPEIISQDTNGFIVFINKNGYWFDDKITINHPIIATHPKLRVIDADSDGLPDFCFYNDITGENYTFLNRGSFKIVYDDPSDPPYYNVFPVNTLKSENETIVSISNINGGLDRVHLWYNSSTGTGQLVSNDYLANTGFVLSSIDEGGYLSYDFHYNTLFSDHYKKTNSIKKPPYTELLGPIKIVSHLFIRTPSKINFIDDTRRQYSYLYEGAMVNTIDRGFLGFQKVRKRDVEMGIDEIAYYSFDSLGVEYITNRLFKTETRFQNNGKLISESFFERGLLKYPNYPSNVTGFNYDTRNRSYLDYTKKATHRQYEIGEKLLSQTTNYQNLDYYGNVVTALTDYGDGFKDSVISVYSNNPTNWILGRLTYSKVFRFAKHKPTTIKSSAFEYDSKGRLIKEITNPDSSAIHQTITQYYFDDFGNITKSDVTAWNGRQFETRTSQTIFDDKGRFITKSINPLGQETKYEYNQTLGLVTKIIDPNGNFTIYEYDNLGRQTQQKSSNGNWQRVRLLRATSSLNSPIDAQYVKQITSSLDPPVLEHYDIFDRLLQKDVISFDGRKIITKNEFNTKGQLSRQSLPYYDGEAIYWDETKYDTLGRVTKRVLPGNRTSTVIYDVGKTTTINPIGQKNLISYNIRNQVTKVVDNNNKELKFEYDGLGQLLKTGDPRGNQTTNTYDYNGQKIKSYDSNSGLFQYFYNGFGELIKQVNSRNQATVIEYDKLGRVTKKIQPEGTTTWIYDIGYKSIGKISSVVSPHETSRYFYDSLGRVLFEKQTIKGKTYTRSFVYDSFGRLKDINHLDGKLIIRQVYNQYNYISEIRDVTTGANKLLWKINKTNALGQTEEQILGNNLIVKQDFHSEKGTINKIATLTPNNQVIYELGYTFDDIGRLSERRHNSKNLREVFRYDNLNRLVKTEVIGKPSVHINYDDLGNITYKSDVGTYIYGSTNNGPHRLISVELNNPSVCVPSLTINTEYNSFNKAATISNDTAKVEILYDSGQQRLMQNLYIGELWQRTRTYVGNYAQIDSTKSKHETTIFIGTPIGIIGTYVITKTNGQTKSNFTYWHKDNLGSIVGLSDENGNLTEFSFDAWGHRRNADWSALTTKPEGYDRGFSSHEHYDIFDLIDMNGRLYDPILARFLSPDPAIQEQSNLQNYNRYSYVFNNPLSYTDPSGYWGIGDVFDFFDDVFGGFGEIINDGFDGVADSFEEYFKFINKYNGTNWLIENKELVINLVATYYLPPGVGAFTATMINSLMAGNSFSDALKASAKSAVIDVIRHNLTGLIGDAAQWTDGYFTAAGASSTGSFSSYLVSVIGHGVVQGAMEVADGGKFMHGFAAGAFTAAVSPVYQGWGKEARVFASAMVGGTAARISGGSFTNGAVSGAFIQMFNHDAHNGESDVSGSSTLDKIQTGLDYAGYLNPFADLANAGIYALRGDFFMAGLSLVAVVPVIGDGVKMAYRAEKFASKSFFENAKYSPKVMKQMGKGSDYRHSFPNSVDGFANSYGKTSTKIGGDGKTYNQLELRGNYRGKDGTFEYIKDKNGVINHRYFKPN